MVSYNFDRSKGPVDVKWFDGSVTNVCYNVVDRIIDIGCGDRVAYYWYRVCSEININYISQGRQRWHRQEVHYIQRAQRFSLQVVQRFERTRREEGRSNSNLYVYFDRIGGRDAVLCSRWGSSHGCGKCRDSLKSIQ